LAPDFNQNISKYFEFVDLFLGFPPFREMISTEVTSTFVAPTRVLFFFRWKTSWVLLTMGRPSATLTTSLRRRRCSSRKP